MPFLTRDTILSISTSDGFLNSGATITRLVNLDQNVAGGNYWLSRAVLATGRANSLGASSAGYGFLMGGRDSGFVDLLNLECYDDSANSYATRSSLPAGVGFGAAWGTAHTYAWGNASTGNTLLQYDKASDTATNKGTFGTGRNGTAGFSLNSYGYFVTGVAAGNSYSTQNQRYDELANTSTAKAALGAGRGAVVGGAMNNFGWISQGSNSGSTLQLTILRYDDALDTWTTRSANSVGRTGGAMFTIGGFIYTAVGSSAAYGITPVPVADAYEYNDFSDTWAQRVSAPANANVPGYHVLNGYGYIAGNDAWTTATYQYRNGHLYQFNSAFKKSFKAPTKVIVGAHIGSRPATVAIDVRSDGTNWQRMESNVDCMPKVGQVLTTQFAAKASGLRDYEVRVSVPQFFGGIAGGTWTTKTALTTARYQLTSFQVGGLGYAYGGTLAGGTASTVNEQYNDATNAWTTKTALGTANETSSSFVLNGNAYIPGGDDGAVYTNTVKRYNDLLDTVTAMATFTTARGAGSTGSMNGLGYFVGGKHAGGAGSDNLTDQYNDATNAWAAKATSGVARDGRAGFISNNFLYSVGGFIGASSTYSQTPDQYSDSADTWTSKANLAATKAGCAGFSTVGPGGYTGYVCSGGNPTKSNTVEQYDESANAWYLRQTAGTARYYLGAMVLNGTPYLVGGFAAAASAEVNQFVQSDRNAVLAVSLRVEE